MRFTAERIQRMPLSEIRAMGELARQVADPVHLEIGEPDFSTPEHIVTAACEAGRRGETHYTPTAGTLELRQAIAAKLERENGIVVDPETEVVATCGASGAIAQALLAVVDPGDEVVLLDPYWSNYLPLVQLAEGTPVVVRLDPEEGFRAGPERLERYLSPRTKALVLNSPANPSGVALSEAELRALVELCVERDILVISDEVYEKIVYDGRTHFSPASEPAFRQHVITCNSLSKTYAMCGWRVGYAAGRADVIRHIIQVQEPTNGNITSVAQAAAVAALNGPQEAVGAMVEVYRRRRDRLVAGLNAIDGLACRKPEGAFYVLVNVGGLRQSSAALAAELVREAGVVTVPGSAFGGAAEGHLRLSFATDEARLDEGLRRLERFVARRRAGLRS